MVKRHRDDGDYFYSEGSHGVTTLNVTLPFFPSTDFAVTFIEAPAGIVQSTESARSISPSYTVVHPSPVSHSTDSSQTNGPSVLKNFTVTSVSALKSQSGSETTPTVFPFVRKT